jgi:hypothetical protein
MSDDQENHELLLRMADELAIRDLVARYVDATNRRDRKAWSATWALKARWVMPDMTDLDSDLLMEGHGEIVSGWVAAMQSYPFVAHMLHSGHVEWADRDSATGRWYVSEVVEDEDGDRHHFYGVYNDRYTRQNDVWLFAERIFSLLYMGDAPWNGQAFPHPQEQEL